MPRQRRGCMVPSCNSNQQRRRLHVDGETESEQVKLSFHELPSNLELRASWLQSISKAEFELRQAQWIPPIDDSSVSVVCSRHFKPEDFKETTRRILTRSAIPTVFDNYPESTQVKNPSRRVPKNINAAPGMGIVAKKTKTEQEADLVQVTVPRTTCINCSCDLTGEETITQVYVTIEDPLVKDDMYSPNGDDGHGLVLKEALSAIFGTILRPNNPLNNFESVVMCYRCAEALSTLYQAFLDFANLSNIDASICQMVRQIQLWNRRGRSTTEESIVPDACHLLDTDEIKAEVEDAETFYTSMEDEGTDMSHFEVESNAVEEKEVTVRTLRKSLRSRDSICSTSSSTSKASADKPKRSFNRAEILADTESSTISREKSQRLRPRNSEAISDAKTVECEDFQAEKHQVTIVDEEDDAEFNSCITPGKRYRRNQTRNKNPLTRASCSLCTRRFPFYWMVELHVLKMHEKIVPEKCPRCNFEYFGEVHGKNHSCTSRVPGMERCRRCGRCGIWLPDSRKFFAHGYRHERDATPFSCPYPDCGKRFKYQQNVDNHVAKFHDSGARERRKEEAKVQCEDCGQVLSSKRTYKSHKKTHFDAREFLCTECGAAFKQVNGLRKHIHFIHSGGLRTYQCPLCQLGFKIAYHLRAHLKSKVHQHDEVGHLLDNIKALKTTGEVLTPTKYRFKDHALWAGKRRRTGDTLVSTTNVHATSAGRNEQGGAVGVSSLEGFGNFDTLSAGTEGGDKFSPI